MWMWTPEVPPISSFATVSPRPSSSALCDARAAPFGAEDDLGIAMVKAGAYRTNVQ